MLDAKMMCNLVYKIYSVISAVKYLFLISMVLFFEWIHSLHPTNVMAGCMIGIVMLCVAWFIKYESRYFVVHYMEKFYRAENGESVDWEKVLMDDMMKPVYVSKR